MFKQFNHFSNTNRLLNKEKIGSFLVQKNVECFCPKISIIDDMELTPISSSGSMT